MNSAASRSSTGSPADHAPRRSCPGSGGTPAPRARRRAPPWLPNRRYTVIRPTPARRATSSIVRCLQPRCGGELERGVEDPLRDRVVGRSARQGRRPARAAGVSAGMVLAAWRRCGRLGRRPSGPRAIAPAAQPQLSRAHDLEPLGHHRRRGRGDQRRARGTAPRRRRLQRNPQARRAACWLHQPDAAEPQRPAGGQPDRAPHDVRDRDRRRAAVPDRAQHAVDRCGPHELLAATSGRSTRGTRPSARAGRARARRSAARGRGTRA